MIEPHHQRLITEKDELEGKCDRLTNFIHAPESQFHHLSDKEKTLLTRQLDAMESYLEILEERIEEFS